MGARIAPVVILCASMFAACDAPAPVDGGLDATVSDAMISDAAIADATLPDATVPDGGGVCCPRGTPSCNCTALGGWAPSLEECDLQGVCDAWPEDFTSAVDSHGCPYWIPGDWPSESGCCNCPPEDGGL